MKLLQKFEVKNELGEGVIWDASRHRFWWTDILQSKLYQLNPLSNEVKSWDTPERLCCFSPIQNSERLVCAFESGFAFYEPDSDDLEWIGRLEQDNPGTRFNDGKTDRKGRLWAGTMVEDDSAATYKGSLYCLDKDLSITKTIGGLSITNSLCWSPDGRKMYHTDTPTRTIQSYEFNTETGEIGECRDFIKTDKDHYPDGSTVDSVGNLWNAQWGGSKVICYSPSGDRLTHIDLPTSQPTCVAFGGEDLNLILVTTAWSEMTEPDSDAGSAFLFETPFTGIKDTAFLTPF